MLKARIAGVTFMLLFAAGASAQSTPIQMTADLTEAPRQAKGSEEPIPASLEVGRLALCLLQGKVPDDRQFVPLALARLQNNDDPDDEQP
jgi:hypothetical protein